ncbi:MAG: hypothetical protein M3R17_17115 [Bacteroidota bacterium]|nr:hypothetical protein [Bacteroidota bacterium]
MKFFTAFLLLCSLTINAQQDKFLKIPSNNDDFRAPVFCSSFEEIFKDTTASSICIFADELKNAQRFDFSKLTELELIEIKFTMTPDTTDAAKKVFIDSINTLMKNMKYFAKCPKLKKVAFCIGEQIYLKKEDTNSNEDNSQRARRWQFDQNVKNAWTAFGKDVSMMLPKVKLYAFTWGW